jgi:DNA-binding MarR family transcriptional regulator
MKPVSRAVEFGTAGVPDGPATGTEAIILADFLPYRLSVLANDVSQGLARIYSARFGISIPEWRVLAALGENEKMTSKAVGLHAHMHKVKVSRAVALLEARGYLKRIPHKGDAREAVLTLSREGAHLYARIVPLARDYARHLTEALSASEQAELDRLLTKLAATMLASENPSDA